MFIFNKISSGGPGLFFVVALWMLICYALLNNRHTSWLHTCCLFFEQLASSIYKKYKVVLKGQFPNSSTGPCLFSVIYPQGFTPDRKSSRPDFRALLSGSVQKAGFLLGIFVVFSFSNLDAATIISTGTGGAWSNPATWVGRAVPVAGDDVTIVSGAMVIIDSDVTVGTLTVSGTLQFNELTPQVLTANNIITVNAKGIFRSAPSGTVKTHQLIAQSSIINNGTIDFSSNSNETGVEIVFTGSGNAIFSCSDAVLTNLRKTNGLILNKGTSAASVLSFMPGNTFQVLSNGDSGASGFLSIINGTFNIIGSRNFSNPVFSTDGNYTIPATGGFWLGNQNATVIAMNGTVTVLGELKIANGTYSVGISGSNLLEILNDGQFKMSGGILNSSGKFKIDGGTGSVSGGKINLAPRRNLANVEPTIDISADARFEMYGDPLITLAFPNSNPIPSNDIQILDGSGFKSIKGGVIQLGTESTPAGSTFLINANTILSQLTAFNTCTIHAVNTSNADVTNTPVSSLPVIPFDLIAPELTAPAKITIQCGETIPAAFATLQEFIKAGGSATDNCTLNPASFKLANQVQSNTNCPYTITRTYEVKDVSGNVGKAEQQIVVEGEAVEPQPEVIAESPVKEELKLKSAMAVYTATQNGNWNDPATWGNSGPPTSADDVNTASYIVTVNADSSCKNITIGAGGTLNHSGTNTLTVTGDWTNNGTYNAGSGIVSFSNTGSTINGATTFGILVINSGSNVNSDIIVNSDLTINDLQLINGLLKINGGTTTITALNQPTVNPIHNTIPKSAGLEVNSGGKLVTQDFTINNKGLIRINSGTANFGNSTGNSVETNTDGAFIVEGGGTVNIAGRLHNSASGTVFGASYTSGITISSGTVTLSTKGNALSNMGSLNVTSAGTFNFNGGTIIFQNASTATTELDLGLLNGTGTKNISGGTFQFGNGSPSGETYNIISEIPLYNLKTNGNANIALGSTLILGNPLTLNGASKLFLNGNSIQIPVSATGTYTFPITDASGTAIPVTVNLTSGSGAIAAGAYIEIKTFDTKYPDNDNVANYLNRYWTLTTSGITSPIYTVNATYLSSDLHNTPAHLTAASYLSPTWTKIAGATIASNTISFSSNATSLEFTALDAPTITITNSKPEVLCSGSSVTLNTTTTADPAFSYLWTPATGLSATNISNPVATPALTTTYTVTVTDGNGLTASDNITITVNPLPTATIGGTTSVCQNAASPTVTFTGASGMAPYTFTYKINGGADQTVTSFSNTATVPVLTATVGTFAYTLVSVKEGSSMACSQVQVGTATITVNPLPIATATPSAQTICSGDATSILLSSTTSGTTFTWTITDLPAGSISGASAGSGTSIVQTLINTTPLQATLTYTITPKVNGCDGTPINVVITVKPKPVLSSSLTPAQSCSNTLFSYVPTSDTPGTTFAWSRATILGISPVGTTGTGTINETLTNITAGIVNVTYVFTLTANGCTNTQNVVVAVLPALTLSSSLSPPAVCSTTPFTYTPTAAIVGVTIIWSRSLIAGISNPASSGTGAINETLINTTTANIVVPYVFTLTSGTCTNTQTVNVTIRPMPELTSTLTPSAICNNTAFNYAATSNVALSSIQWSRAVVAGISNVAGFGATNAINETLINTTADPIVVTYAFILRAAGCQNNQNVTVTVNPTPKLSGTLTPAAICSNSVFSYTPASLTVGTTFSWTRAAVAGISNAAALGTGNVNETLINSTTSPVSVNYVYTLTANGCTNTQNVVVVVNSLPVVTATTSNATICEGSNAILTASGASTYSWNPGTGLSSITGASVTANPTNTTTYTVTGTDANGCVNVATVTVNVLPRPNVTVTSSNGTICNGGSSTLTGNGAVSYSWSPASGLSATTGSSVTANPTVTTTYTVTGTAANGCTNTASVTITVNAPFTVTATASPAVICEGNSSTLTASGALSYVWSPDTDLSSPTGSSVTATPSTTTTYTVVGTDANGCTNSTTVTVTVNPMPVLTNPNPSPATICGGTGFNYAPTSSVSGTNFSWTRNTPVGITSSAPTSGTGDISNHILTNTTASPIPVTYTYTLTANGCTNPITYAVVIVVIPAPTVNVFANGSTALTICEGTSVNLTSSSSLVFQDPNLTPATGFSGWTASRGTSPAPSNGTIPDADWTLRSDGYSYGGTTFDSPDGQFYLSNARDQGGNGDTHTILQYGPVNTTNYTTLSLNFYHYYRDGGGSAGDNAYVEASTNGSTWNNLATYTNTQGAANGFVNLATPLNLSAYINNPTVYIRFRYRATNPNNAYYWAIGRVNFTGTSADNPVISWTSNPAGFTSNVANPPAALSPTVTTTYTVTYTDPTADPNTLCPGSASVTVTVRPEPTMTSSNTVAICSGSSVNLPLTSDVPSTYSWIATTNGSVTGESTSAQTGNTINDVLTNTTNNPVNVIYTVTPTAITGSCVGNPQTVTITVNPTPTVDAVANRSAVCSGTSAAAIPFGSNVTGATYDWTSTADVGFGTSGTGNIPAYTATNSTNAPVNATVSVTATANGCTGPVRTFTVAVNPVPAVTIDANYCPAAPNQDKIELTAETGPGTYTYLWSTGQTSKAIYVDIADSYSVVVTNTYGCSTTAFLPVSNEMTVNGDFEAGNTGFFSGYTYHADLPGLVPAGQGELYDDSGTNGYAVTTNGQNVHVNFWGRDHTSGSGNFMIVNGHGNTITIWEQGPLTVIPGTTYYFSAYAISLNSAGNYANLQFSINHSTVGLTQTSTGVLPARAQNNTPPFNWTRFYGKWTAPAGVTSATITIVDLVSALSGNDFGLDDISFGTLDPVPGKITPSVAPGPVCQYGNLQLLANKTSIKTPFTYSWTGPNGFTSTDENPLLTNISSANNGTYTLSFTDGYGCNTLTGSVTVTVNSTPVCSITGPTATIPNATDIFTAPAGMATYDWMVTGNGTIVGSSNGRTVNVQAGATCTGSYTVTVTITESSGCNSTCNQVVSLNDNSKPVVTGAFLLQTINGCLVADAPAATTVAQLEALPGNVVISDAFTPKALLTVTHSDVVAGTCPIAITRTYTVTDACGNSVNITQNINVQDVIFPVISGALSPVTVSGCSAADAPAAVTTVAALEALAGGVAISDNCTPDGSLTVTSSDVSSGTCIVTITRTYTIKDACNNPATLVQVITVQDNVAPTWTTLANALDVTVQCGDAVGLASAQSLAPVATDLCSTLSAPVKTSGAFVAGGTCPQVGSYTNTWVVTDACGNTSAVFTQVIRIEDTTAPVWTTPLGSLNVFLECDDADGIAAAQAMIPVATDNCGGSYSAVKTSGGFVASGACSQAGAYTNTFIITDNCGNVSIPFTQIITLEDNTAPDIIAPAVAVISCLDDPNNLTLTGSPIVTDNCDVATIITHSDSSVPTTCGGDYKITRTWTATDHCGNSNSAVQEIFVQDIDAPVISALPAPFTIDCDDAPNFTTPTAIDACASSFTLTSADVTTPGTCANSYSITRTWTAKDACGNTSMASQTINVQDIVAPVINCPAAVNAIAGTAECGATGIALGTPTVTDNCSTLAQITITNDAPALFPVGVTTVTWTATDACGNYSTCTQNVSVADNNLPPTINCPVSTNVSEPDLFEDFVSGNGCIWTPTGIPNPTFDDNCDVVAVTYVLSGATVGNSLATGFNYITNASLNVGITTVTYTAHDAAGNKASCAIRVWIKNIDAPRFTVTCPAIPNKDIVVPAESGLCDAEVTVPAPVIDNYCNEVFTITYNGAAVSTTLPLQPVTARFTVGVHPIQWIITDASGIPYICDQTVEVTDANSALTCPVDIERPVNPGEDFATLVQTGDPTVIGNCEDPTLGWVLVPPAAFASEYDIAELSGTGIYPTNGTFFLGVTTITYSLVDAGGNVVIDSDGDPITCSFKVTITDQPVIDCPDSEVFNADENCERSFDPGVPTLAQGSQPLTWAWALSYPGNPPSVPAVNLSGGSATTSLSPIPSPIVAASPHAYDFQLGVTTIVWTATDLVGNIATCIQTVTVEDKEDPTFTPKSLTACVDMLHSAVYNETNPNPNNGVDPNLIISPSPDYYTFVKSSTLLDLTDHDDNCCDPEDLIINWRIVFTDVPDPLNPSGPKLVHPSITWTGQPSTYGSDILMWGDGVNFTPVTHSIFYWVEDCHGNISDEQERLITITPRPEIIKMN